MTDQFFLVEKLEGAIPLHIDSVPKVAVNCWEHGNDHAHLVIDVRNRNACFNPMNSHRLEQLRPKKCRQQATLA